MEEAAAPVEVATPKKSGGKLGIIAAVVLLVGAAAAGGLYGGRLLQPPAAAAKAPPEKPAEVPKASAALPSLVVDLRDRNGDIHHVKIGISFELGGETSEEEFAKCLPRGREAAIIYLRTQTFESVSDNKRFETLRKELLERVADAVGKQRVQRVLLTDFVAQ